MSLFVLKSTFMAIPQSQNEAVEIDGASSLRSRPPWPHRASRTDASRAKKRVAQVMHLCGAFACGSYSSTAKAGVFSVAVIRQ